MTSRLITLLENNAYRSYTKAEYDAMKKLPGNILNPLFRTTNYRQTFWSGDPNKFSFSAKSKSEFEVLQGVLTEFNYPFEYISSVSIDVNGSKKMTWVVVSPILVWYKSGTTEGKNNFVRLLDTSGKLIYECSIEQITQQDPSDIMALIYSKLGIAMPFYQDNPLATDEQQIAYATRYKSAYQDLITKGIQPGDAVKLKVLKKFPLAIQWMPDPTEQMQLTALKSIPNNSKAYTRFYTLSTVVKNPTEEFSMKLIDHYPGHIKHLVNPSDKLIFHALQNQPNLIQYFCDGPQTLKFQLAAVKQTYTALREIKNPAPLIQAVACQKSPSAINLVIPVESADISLLKQHRSILYPAQLAYLEKIEQQEQLTESVDVDMSDWSEQEKAHYRKALEISSQERDIAEIVEYINSHKISDRVLIAIFEYMDIIDYVDCANLSIPVQLWLVNEYAWNIQCIKSPAPMIQAVACRKQPGSINLVTPIESIDISLLKKYRDILNPPRSVYLEKIEKQERLTETINIVESSVNTPEEIEYILSQIKAYYDQFVSNRLSYLIYIDYCVSLIKKLINPSLETQLAIVAIDPFLLPRLNTDNIDVQIAAIGQRHGVFSHIKNPSIRLQLLTVQEEPLLITYISRPSPLVQWAAIKAGIVYDYDIQKIINLINPPACIDPSIITWWEEQQSNQLTESTDHSEFSHREQAQFDQILEIHNTLPNADLKFYFETTNISERVLISLIKIEPYLIWDIPRDKITVKMQLAAVHENSKALVDNPPPLVQTVACKNYPRVINLINPISAIDFNLMKKYYEYLTPERRSYFEAIKDELLESVDLNMPKRTLNGLTEEQQVEYVKLHQDDEPDHILDDVIMDSNLSEAVKLKILAINGAFLGCFEKPWSLIFQLAAVKSKPGSILMIENPAPMIQWAAFQKSKSAIWDIYPPSCVLPEIIAAYNEWASEDPWHRKPYTVKA